ncbi:hypothetical protein AB0N09_28225 [Streptomyces erythrochromogenes]|uniref:hypothetical protein n=1 Tax=Streptomyces erythrochromogenes TaxID=285574 RepID=UPI00343C512D
MDHDEAMVTDTPDGSNNHIHDPRELAGFLAARLAGAQQQVHAAAAIEASGTLLEPAFASAALARELYAKRELLRLHPGAADRGSYCDGCVGPYDYTPQLDGHCPVQLVLARIWQDHPDFPAWVLSEPVKKYRHAPA